jgi:outer membrane receptor protein involved in Fe transport
MGTATGFAGASVSYVGNRLGPFLGRSLTGSPLPRAGFPDYTQIDARVGVRYDAWQFDVFVNNVADERGLLGGGGGSFNAATFNYIQPRTMGLSLSKAF